MAFENIGERWQPGADSIPLGGRVGGGGGGQRGSQQPVKFINARIPKSPLGQSAMAPRALLESPGSAGFGGNVNSLVAQLMQAFAPQMRSGGMGGPAMPLAASGAGSLHGGGIAGSALSPTAGGAESLTPTAPPISQVLRQPDAFRPPMSALPAPRFDFQLPPEPSPKTLGNDNRGEPDIGGPEIPAVPKPAPVRVEPAAPYTPPPVMTPAPEPIVLHPSQQDVSVPSLFHEAPASSPYGYLPGYKRSLLEDYQNYF